MVPSVSSQLFGLSLLVSCAVGQILRFGHCPYFSPLKDFEMNKYLGTWYQIERYFSFPGMGGKCWTQNYYPDAEIPGKFKLRMDYRDVVVENKLTVDMDIFQDFPEDPATLTSQFFGIPLIAFGYQVLSTDYTNYAIEWRCEERGLFQHRESLWILTRSPYPKPWIVKEARAVVESLGLKMTSLRAVSQDCHLPPALKRFYSSQKRNNFSPAIRVGAAGIVSASPTGGLIAPIPDFVVSLLTVELNKLVTFLYASLSLANGFKPTFIAVTLNPYESDHQDVDKKIQRINLQK